MEKFDPAFGDELSLQEAMEMLGAWHTAGAMHGFSYKTKDEGGIILTAKISFMVGNGIICKGDKTRLFLSLAEAQFLYGPMVKMEYPVKQESRIRGLHVFLKTGNYLFISSQAELPDGSSQSMLNLSDINLNHDE